MHPRAKEAICLIAMCILAWTQCHAESAWPSVPLRTDRMAFPETLDEAKAAYPDARFVKVRPEEFNGLRERYEAAGYVVSDLPRMRAQAKDQEKTDPEQSAQSQGEAPSQQEPDQPRVGVMGDIPLNGGGKDAAVVVFIIIGIVVVAFIAVAGLQALYNVVVNGERHPYWLMAEAAFGFVAANNPDYSSSTPNGQREYLDYFDDASVRLRAGLMNSSHPENDQVPVGLGLVAEAGRLAGYVTLANTQHDIARVDGSYLMMGPSFAIWGSRTDQIALFMDLMAGASSNSTVKTLALARLSVLYPVRWDEPGWYAGVDLGALYIQLDESKGLIRQGGDFNQVTSFIGGYKF